MYHSKYVLKIKFFKRKLSISSAQRVKRYDFLHFSRSFNTKTSEKIYVVHTGTLHNIYFFLWSQLLNFKTCILPWTCIWKILKKIPEKALGVVHYPCKFENVRFKIVEYKNLLDKLVFLTFFGRYLRARMR